MDESFFRLTDRLSRTQFYSDEFKNIDILQYLRVIEDYVYGVKSQYDRIKENISKIFNIDSSPLLISSTQARLDIYYFTLTWDKISKVYGKFHSIIRKDSNKSFYEDFRIIHKRMDHLLGEFKNDVRNEYEHPSLKPHRVNGIIDWGSLSMDSNGNIKIHVGKDQFAFVKKSQVDKLISIWYDLIDVFIKHFSNKPSSSQLLEFKKNIEQNIDNIVEEYKQNVFDGNHEEASRIIGNFLSAQLYLSTEGIPLSQDIINKFNSSIFYSKRN